jgi:hypothetical protein
MDVPGIDKEALPENLSKDQATVDSPFRAFIGYPAGGRHAASGHYYLIYLIHFYPGTLKIFRAKLSGSVIILNSFFPITTAAPSFAHE